MNEKLVTIAEFSDSIQANFAKQKLVDSDIKCILIGENAANVYSGLDFVKIELQTLESNAEKAKEILES